MKILIDFIILFLVYFFLLFRKWKTRGKDVLLINTTMYIYLTFVLYFTSMPIIASLTSLFNHPYLPMNLVPFIDVLEGRGDFVRQIGLNVIMTIPYGFLLPFTKKGNAKFIKVILHTFLLSLCIELLQPMFSGVRSSDITDIITNVVGGMIGYGFYVLLKPISSKLLTFIRSM